MDPIPNPMIPEAYANFAKACAALAESHGISTFQLRITPKWRDPMPAGVQLHGDVQINYAATDGRGRPCTNLNVYLTTNTQLGVIRNAESSS